MKVYLTLPVLNETENLEVLLSCIEKQQFQQWKMIVCVNQPDEWWHNPIKLNICEDNQAAISWLESRKNPKIQVIDKSSPGNGWKGKNHGVGWARKTAMDEAALQAEPEDIIISIDADTLYPSSFINSVISGFEKYPQAAGLSAPYYHKLTGETIADRCLLRYEIYMRNYALNMLLCDNPYAFSAIGSGMACKANTYLKNGGLTPKLSGEDFYFIQKLRKQGNIIIGSGTYIYPAARFSDRVYFGTGPAMIKGKSGNWDSYPIYHSAAFLKVKQTFSTFNKLFISDLPTPMDSLLKETAKNKPLWEPLRANAKTVKSFEKACMQKADALRILQYLKETNINYPESNEVRLSNFLQSSFHMETSLKQILNNLSFDETSIPDLNAVRDFMATREMELQQMKEII